MKKTFLSLILVAGMSFGPGCAVLNNPSTVQRISSAAKIASYVGTAEYVRIHPETRTAFQTAVNSLSMIEQSETIDATLLLAIVNQLPVKELKSERATIIITAATIIVSDYIGTIPADQTDKIRPLVKAMREGIELGLMAGTTFRPI